MKLIYRITSGGYAKEKPAWAGKAACLRNAIAMFPPADHDWLIIADRVLPPLRQVIESCRVPTVDISVGHGAGTFRMAVKEALTADDATVVYVLEDDYLHQPDSARAIEEALGLPIHYVTLYDHPDKYRLPEEGGNPALTLCGEPGITFKTPLCWWRTTNSTTMSFATRVGQLREDWPRMRPHVAGRHPYDYEMWLDLTSDDRRLVSPIPSFSTHGETAWLADDRWTPHTWEALGTLYSTPPTNGAGDAPPPL